MISKTIFTILVIVSVVAAFKLRGLRNNTTSIQQQEAEVSSRILNGHIASSEIPYQVGLKINTDRGQGTCGGSLISHLSVLTAAHCLINGRTVDVYLGGKKFSEAATVYRVEMHQTIMHRHFVRSTRQNDIALVIIPRVTLSSNRIGLVVLPPQNVQSYVNVQATLAGWGLYSPISNQLSDELRVSTFSVMSEEGCAAFYGHDSEDNSKMCTSTASGFSGCKGDSGSPLTIINHENKVMQIGVYLSHGSQMCDYGEPNLFSRVDHYMRWIRANGHFLP